MLHVPLDLLGHVACGIVGHVEHGDAVPVDRRQEPEPGRVLVGRLVATATIAIGAVRVLEGVRELVLRRAAVRRGGPAVQAHCLLVIGL